MHTSIKKIIIFRIRLAWSKYQNLRYSKERLSVALYGSDLAHTSDRIDTFSELYSSFAEVHIVNEEFSQFNTSSWLSNSKSAFSIKNIFAENENIFLKQAIQKVVAIPFDIIHLFEPSVPYIFLAMLHKLIWGAKVLVDIDESPFNPSAEKPRDIRDYLEKKQDLNLEKTEWKRFSLNLIEEINSITVSNMMLQLLFGGEIIGKLPDGGSLINGVPIKKFFNFIKESCKDYNKQESFIDIFLVAFMHLMSWKKTASQKRVRDASPINDTRKSCMVTFEEVTIKTASGWAVCTEDKNKRILFKVNLNYHPLHIVDTTRFRNDIKKEHGGDGFVGYKAEMTEYIDFSSTSEISVDPMSHVTREKDCNKNLPCLLKGLHFTNVNEKAKKLLQRNFYSFNHKLKKSADSFSVSIIILNLNGLNVLQRCLQSICEHTVCDFEVIVIDHGSTDGSVEFLKNSIFLNLISFFRGKNYSFSSSDNFAAQKAQGDILVFMNNDMTIVDDAISAMARTALHSDFGLVGIKLWDMPQGLPVEISKSLNVVQHLGVHFRDCHRDNVVEAYETRLSAFWSDEQDLFETPAVTAAMMALTKSDFLMVGGFDEDYFYGQEDVDFCLTHMRSNFKKTGPLLSHGSYHARVLILYNYSAILNSSLKNYRVVLQQKMGRWMRKKLGEDQIKKSEYLCPKPYSVAMIVSEINFETDKADYFSARELGDAFEKDTGAVVGYFSTNEKEIDVSGYDTVIGFIDGVDPARLNNLGPSTYLIAWARNWFDRWCERAWVHMYNLLFASSESSRQYMEEVLLRKVHLLRIAASNRCIEGGNKTSMLQSDYCFTDSHFDSPREIAAFLDPSEIPHNFNLYEHNWESPPEFSNYTRGAVIYEDIPSVYASTKLVVDDANIATKKWGSLNCRVFNAIASETMCITNNITGIQEIFNVLRNHSRKTKISIKIAEPTLTKFKSWDDLYFAIPTISTFKKYLLNWNNAFFFGTCCDDFLFY